MSSLHSANYAEALAEIAHWLKGPDGIGPQKIAEMDAFFLAHAGDYVDASLILTNGSSWGGLYEQMIGRPLAPGLRFRVDDADDEVGCYRELL